jgi:hypothetical protein
VGERTNSSPPSSLMARLSVAARERNAAPIGVVHPVSVLAVGAQAFVLDEYLAEYFAAVRLLTGGSLRRGHRDRNSPAGGSRREARNYSSEPGFAYGHCGPCQATAGAQASSMQFIAAMPPGVSGYHRAEGRQVGGLREF